MAVETTSTRASVAFDRSRRYGGYDSWSYPNRGDYTNLGLNAGYTNIGNNNNGYYQNGVGGGVGYYNGGNYNNGYYQNSVGYGVAPGYQFATGV